MLYNRRETYSAELPSGVLVLTCGVDTQDNRLEYEVVGYGRFGESWGIEYGYIMGKPDTSKVWETLDNIIDKSYSFANGKKLKISLTFVDSGGHYTQEVYEACYQRRFKNVFAIKGKGGADIPYTQPPSKIPLGKSKSSSRKVFLYTIGVDSGKQQIMDKLKTDKSGRKKWEWVKVANVPNEPLDVRNYANAAFAMLHPNLEKIENYLKGVTKPATNSATPKSHKKKNRYLDDLL